MAKNHTAPVNAKKRTNAAKEASRIRQIKKRKQARRTLAIMGALGIIAIIGGYFLQNSALFSVRADLVYDESAVQLNEIMTDNYSALVTESGDVPDWIEITNTGDTDVNIGKYSLLLNSEYNHMFVFPDYILGSGEYLTLYADGAEDARADGGFSVPFRLSASGGETLQLLNAQGKMIDEAKIPEMASDQSYFRDVDGSWTVGAPSPGMDNRSKIALGNIRLEADVLTISEVMSENTLYLPDENGEFHDYVEIFNTSDQNVSLKGWYLSDSSNKLRRWAFPEFILPAGGYLAVHCSGYDETENADRMHANFKISNEGETLYLSRSDGHTVAMVDIPALETNQALSLVNGEWTTDLAPTPGLANQLSSAGQVNADVFGSSLNGVFISEIMASPSDQAYDWIEIYNGSDDSFDLSGYGLSDNSNRPRKWQFPQGTVIAPGKYLGVYASGLDKHTLNGFLNADFALAADGGYTITLSDPQGAVLDAIYVSEQYTGISYGRASDQTGLFYFEQSTPGAANTGSRYLDRADTARPSVKGGLFVEGESFSVELEAPVGARIYYTLDCSTPTESAALYTGPIQISGTTILRTRVYADDCLPSFVDTQSYLYDVSNDSGIYVISLVSDEQNLLGEKGILTQYREEWEKEASFELFTSDGIRVLGQGCGISLHGQDSRKMPVKTFNIIARRQYGGTNRFKYPIFNDRDHAEYQSFLLRASGEDYNRSFMRDSVLSSLMEETSVFYQECEPAIVYMNGRYYSLIYIRERTNTYAICQHEGWEGMEDQIDLTKGNDVVMQGSDASYKELLEYIQSNDMTSQAAYDYLDSCIDIQNYIEYMSLQIFTGNTDTLNVKRYRNPETDGKWRWVLFDLDWAFYTDTNSIRRWLTPGGVGSSNGTDNSLFIGCMKNPIFRDQFMTYFGQQMATTFSTESVLQRMQDHYNSIKAVLPQYLEQWDVELNDGMHKIYSYAETRPAKLVNDYFKNAMKMSDEQMELYFGDAMDKIELYSNK